MSETLEPQQMRTYLAFSESAALLQFAVQRQLRADADLSYVQFEILATLNATTGAVTMTDLADRVVYSRSGLTHQASLLEKAGLIARSPSPDDQRATIVEITESGRDRVTGVLPGHIDVVRDLLYGVLDDDDITALGEILTRVRDHMRSRPARSRSVSRSSPAG
ncbi:MarR family winged helix-turn-helix transcriptional regulator [Williamsia deligens]|uniref:MarR family winged helix-turn-helix transcriptional regulator n=1 Tax=Williamsia deligens TaxID=321325 RepID=A0ABW3G7G0_9NOCA|nr:MarR family transcriptional regulator [Williamsia deligens]MCP2193659.1 DNA-binding transcriptional regulator, MarR family [Williamsia deligens]